MSIAWPRDVDHVLGTDRATRAKGDGLEQHPAE